jgi:hypothetical protein
MRVPNPGSGDTTLRVDRRVAQIARNEALYREMNAGLATMPEWRAAPPGERHEFFCECGDSLCQERIHLDRAEYEALRGHPMRFAVRPGHARPGAEHVVATSGDHLVVEKEEEVRPIVDPAHPRYGADGPA